MGGVQALERLGERRRGVTRRSSSIRGKRRAVGDGRAATLGCVRSRRGFTSWKDTLQFTFWTRVLDPLSRQLHPMLRVIMPIPNALLATGDERSKTQDESRTASGCTKHVLRCLQE